MSGVIYFARTDDEMEAEGFYDEKGNLISWWSCNDAQWRHEYFNSFMQKLGVDVRIDTSLNQKLTDHLRQLYG